MVWENLALKKPEQFYRRLRFVAAGISFLMALLLARLFWMQVIQGGEYRDQAEHNSIRVVPVRAARGVLFDRHMKVLAGNTPNLSVGLIPAELLRHPEKEQEVIGKMASLLGMDPDRIRDKFDRQKARPYAPVRLQTDIDRGLVTRLEEMRQDLPGVVVMADSKRVYPAPTAPHALGYVGEIAEKQVERMSPMGYRQGDMLGQAGLEKVYDQVLRGEDGGRQVRIDSAGRELGIIREYPARTGSHLVLTLDLTLQQAAEEALGENAGAIVALDPRNGEVLVMASKPDFDPGIFSGRVSGKAWGALMKDERYPLSNRCIQGLYPPGSVFKLVTTAAGLQSGVVTPETMFECLGIYWIATWPYRCWKEIGHGYLSLDRAMTESCDIFFYQWGLKVKVGGLHKYAVEFGMGSATGIDLPDEAEGLVPSAEWKEQTQHMPWFPGNTVMMSIGQGYTLVTPLQLAMMTAAIANGGDLYRPRFMKKAVDEQFRTLVERPPELLRKVDASEETFRLIRQGMEHAVEAPKGTAWRARVKGVSVAGKTGTAQNPHGEDHAAFVCFAPSENPQIAIAVLVENGGEGGLTAAPMARKVMEAFFEK